MKLRNIVKITLIVPLALIFSIHINAAEKTRQHQL